MAFSTDDTIVAIATPPGRGGLGVVRLSGAAALEIARALTGGRALEPRRATFTLVNGVGAQDEAIVTWFQAPHSYTGEDVVELSLHGSPVLLQAIVSAAVRQGARLAEPGEFTLRAYLSGRLDLVQAEAVCDLVNAVTPLQARTAFDQLEGTLTGQIGQVDARVLDLAMRLEASLDFPEEGYHFVGADAAAADLEAVIARIDELLAAGSAGRLVREGATVVIAGRPNAGKSTLFNALAGAARAIVTEVPGTTRDLLTERVDIGGVAVTLVDTAGLREESADPIEIEGMVRARSAAAHAALVLLVVDPTDPDAAELSTAQSVFDAPMLLVASKADLPARWQAPAAMRCIDVSAVTGAGLDALRRAIVETLGGAALYRDAPAITNVRHLGLLERTRAALVRARDAAGISAPEELIAADLAEAREAIEEIVGRRSVEDVLRGIFERFCIGK